jgi:GNAT superfamily N-acetyltransferase
MKQLDDRADPRRFRHRDGSTVPTASPPGAVRIRPYDPHGEVDAERVRAMSAWISSRSLYERFFSGTPRLPEPYLRALTMVDHHDREALLALSGDTVVGIAEYVRNRRAPERADLAVLVADGWQRRGIARGLVTQLGRLAADRGIADFTADALQSNRPALAAIASVWPGARASREGTTATFTLPVRAVAGTRIAVA